MHHTHYYIYSMHIPLPAPQSRSFGGGIAHSGISDLVAHYGFFLC